MDTFFFLIVMDSGWVDFIYEYDIFVRFEDIVSIKEWWSPSDMWVVVMGLLIVLNLGHV